ncbi:glycosyl transferase family WbsX [Winogradskyella wandonensis]|uniref:Glycosyl transferase family WbsX n=1 Tax=Winogradskyella wandonensis TaxID=1442586 RepID=A0A4R1KVS1_9FLAO|nr:glycoside hydrolase family 99-like domain-containing protein [Winogradskyella wandonensis]TCK68817.1 glycosyl transferase family WbsX [Winogradskyella wandonensis]
MPKLRPIAFVLPQFHPIPENDKWWGKGFTEWTNVKKAKPLFKGHYQPHVPADLGYYDLREPEARLAQAQLAQKYGIHGFCYYHYWFNGKRLLNYPIDEILRLQEPNMPFMLCWANENWTRRWDGLDQDILIEQNYNFEDDKNHMRWLCSNVFKDKRYIRVDNKPVFVVYRHQLFPDISKTAKIWRDIAVNEFGYDGLYLCITESFNDRSNPESINFDAAVEFSPHQVIRNHLTPSISQRILSRLGFTKHKDLDKRDFKTGVEESLKRRMPKYKLFRCVTPSWDNTARKKENGVIAIGSNPKLYYKWLNRLVKAFKPYSRDENFIFINALNEWAEGNHLEPCKKYGTAYFEATKKALDS